MCNSESMPTTPPFPLYFSIVWISLQNSCASSLVRMTSIAVSSPARLPTSPVISMPSMATQAARCHSRHGLEHNDVLGQIKGDDPLLENRAQPAGDIQRRLAL